MLDPFADIKPVDNEIMPAKTMVKFSDGNPILCTGDIDGDVNVYRLYGNFIYKIRLRRLCA